MNRREVTQTPRPGCRKKGGWRWLALVLTLPTPGPAVLFYSTADPAHNTNPPTGALTNSGWQYQGAWGSFLGTPIAPKYFLAAAHVGGAVGDSFHFRGVAYTTTAMFDDTNSDLRLWRICGTFPDYAPLYTLRHEIRKPVVVFGRGTQRGAEVLVSGPLSPSLKGWQWGSWDGVQRWGTNVVSAVLSGDTLAPTNRPVGDLLQCDFDASGGSDEAHLSFGDSSGGLFIQDDTVWKLAGVNYAVDGPYATNASEPGFSAAIFDEGGLYQGDPGDRTLTPDLPADVPGAFYATRVSAHLAWINGVVQSSSADPPPVLVSADNVIGPYGDTPGAVIDPRTKTVTVPIPAQNRFYLLRACDSIRITSIKVSGPTLVMTYE